MTLLAEKNIKYWTTRADGYSKVNKDEIITGQDIVWINEIKAHIPDDKNINILDIGTGPGFFAIILANEGYNVTAVDYTDAMLKEAKENAKNTLKPIKFLKMDAQKLEFEDETFDVVITRNLTWNLEFPEKAYSEWTRVLKKGGILLNFDANWYSYLYNDKMRIGYESDRENVAKAGADDHYTCTDIEAMENIALNVPLSKIDRPKWDLDTLKKIGMNFVSADRNVWKRVWADIEKLNYASTPMFLVKGVK